MSNNPLQQYFRRPSVFLKLPSGGKGYAPGALDLPDNGEIPIYPMTAIDEITSKTPDALFNGSAIAEIIKSCAPNIKDPWNVVNIDLDPLLVAIRAATHGSMMEITTTCPSCDEESKYDVNLGAVLAEFKPGDYETLLPLNEDVIVKFKPMTYAEINEAAVGQFSVQRAINSLMALEDVQARAEKTNEMLLEINSMSINVIANSIEYIKVPGATVFEKPFLVEFLNSCDRNAFEKIKDFSVSLRQSTETKPLHITCVHCQHEFDQPFDVNPVNFFG